MNKFRPKLPFKPKILYYWYKGYCASTVMFLNPFIKCNPNLVRHPHHRFKPSIDNSYTIRFEKTLSCLKELRGFMGRTDSLLINT